MQTKFIGHPRLESFRGYQVVEILLNCAIDSKCIERGGNLGRLTRMPTLSTRPLKKYLRNNSVWRLVVTLTTHQEEVSYVVRATKRARNDMATLQRNLFQHFNITRQSALDRLMSYFGP